MTSVETGQTSNNPKIFADKDARNIHMARVRDDADSNKTKCTICKQIFADEYARNFHMARVHDNADSNKTKCTICQQIFADKDARNFHMARNGF